MSPQPPPKRLPLLSLCIFLVFLVLGLIFLSYVLFWGAILGGVIYLVSQLSQHFFSSKHQAKRKPITIDQED